MFCVGTVHDLVNAFELNALPAGDLLTVSRKLFLGPHAKPTPDSMHQKAPEKLPVSVQQRAILHDGSSNVESNFQHLESLTHTRHLSGQSDDAVSMPVHHTPRRHLTPSNQVVGGVFLHNKRLTEVISCAPRFAKKLTHTCRYTTSTGIIERGVLI